METRFHGVIRLAAYLALVVSGAPAFAQGTRVLATPVGAPAEQRVALDLGQGLKMEFVLIPAGKFMMGSSDKMWARVYPLHQVTISKPFYMGVTAVTQEQYETVMGTNPSHFKGAKNPVEQVSLDDAVKFCEKLSKNTGRKVRLPTEAQWEYACRAGTTTPFNTGETLSTDQANYSGEDVYGKKTGQPREKTVPVASFKPNAWGLYDMHGNVAQWVSDWYGPYARQAVTDPAGAAKPAAAEQLDRITRGGSYFTPLECCQSGSRSQSRHDTRADFIGFRACVDSD
ncbi:MAG: formylglycine-generating enzyme family protein [Tepidisphaeraceae bacterium]|jgi:formylglycine-generating enzyme required for sulfatase activity